MVDLKSDILIKCTILRLIATPLIILQEEVFQGGLSCGLSWERICQVDWIEDDGCLLNRSEF